MFDFKVWLYSCISYTELYKEMYRLALDEIEQFISNYVTPSQFY